MSGAAEPAEAMTRVPAMRRGHEGNLWEGGMYVLVWSYPWY